MSNKVIGILTLIQGLCLVALLAMSADWRSFGLMLFIMGTTYQFFRDIHTVKALFIKEDNNEINVG